MIENKGDPVYVATSGKSGRGLFSSRKFSKGEVIFSERPLAAMQSLRNIHEVVVCRECMRYVGDISIQMNLLRGTSRRECIDMYFNAHERKTRNEKHGFLSAVVQCDQLCGEIYCSATCKNKHWSRSHSKLCVGAVPESDIDSNPLVKFKSHAFETNEIFLLVAEVLCHQLNQLIERSDQEKCVVVDLYSGFVRNLWWDVLSDENKHISDNLKSLCSESLFYLKSSLQNEVPENTCNELLTLENFSRCVGMFEQNNVAIGRESPILYFFHENKHHTKTMSMELLQEFRDIISEREMLPEDEVEELNQMSACEISETYDLTNVFPSLDGTALYTYICCMNHSCAPNCTIMYDYDEAANMPLEARIIASEDISEGDELFHCYIDQEMSIEERQEALQEYSFSCDCRRCIDESKK